MIGEVYHKTPESVNNIDIPLDEASMTPYEQAKNYYACNHETTETRYKVYSNGTKHYFAQCLKCGRQVGTAISHKDVSEYVQEWDKGLETGYQFLIDTLANQIRDEQEALWRNRESEWHKAYQAYLQSPLWQSKRRRVLARDDRICQACLRREATQVHHKRYPKEFGKEPLFDLVSVCDLCHDALHELREQGVDRG